MGSYMAPGGLCHPSEGIILYRGQPVNPAQATRSSIHVRATLLSHPSPSSPRQIQHELLTFTNSVSDPIGPGGHRLLSEIWLDERASLDCIPEPASPDWLLVSLPSGRFAVRLIDMCLSTSRFSESAGLTTWTGQD
jgi:hypothetical protein